MCLEWGNIIRLPLVPAEANNDPIEQACPITIVCISDLTYCMVSYMAIPAVTNPPGEFMYKTISLPGACDSKNNNWAHNTEAVCSPIGPSNIIILSLSKREKMS